VLHYCTYDWSEKALRESVLIRRVNDFVDKLLVNKQPVVNGRWGDEPFQPENPKNFPLALAIFYAVKASHLNIREVAASLEHKFGGKLRRKSKGWQDTTSIGLFINEVECLLRNLYGDFDDDAVESTREAISVIVQQFLRFIRNDLWLEHESAQDIDDSYNMEPLLDQGFCGGDILRYADQGAAYLFDWVRDFRRNPSAFGQYTASFLKAYESKCARTNLGTANEFIDFAATDSNNVLQFDRLRNMRSTR
jgi:hypothetical protein